LILIIATFVVVYLLAAAAPSIPRLLILGATVALVLSFPVRVLSRWMGRKWAIFVAVGSTIFFSLLLLLLLIPFLVSEISDFITVLPVIVDDTRELLRTALTEVNTRGWIDQDPDELVSDLEAGLFSRAQELAETILANVLEGTTRTLSILISTFGVIFIATYLLIDIPRFKQTFINAFSANYQTDADQLWTTIGDSLSRYLGGLLVSITIHGGMAAIGLWLLGVPYFFVLGIWMAVTAILPYIGAFLGGIPAVIIALTISWQLAVVTIVLYVVINQFEGNLITPRIQGNAVRVHPVMIFIAVLLGNALGGILGVIIAVPRLAIVRVLAEFFWVRLRVRGTHDTLLAAIGGDQTTEFPPVLSSADTPPQEPAGSGPTARGTANRDTTGR
jgi:predicted PurR-regulated permease PerM